MQVLKKLFMRQSPFNYTDIFRSSFSIRLEEDPEYNTYISLL